MSNLLPRLAAIKDRWIEIGKQIIDPEIIADQKQYSKLMKEYKDLEEMVEVYHEFKNVVENIESSEEVLHNEKDPDFKELAKEELDALRPRKIELEEKIKFMLIPKDPEDIKDAIVEVRAGTGGDEASIFAGDLFRMYSKYCDTRGWSVELMDYNEGTMGGYKEVVFKVSGNNVYGDLKFEAGVHRVQRVPQTETQGRVHTSAASVMVLPEADEFDVQIKDSDVRVDSFCSSGPGGQSVNTTYSAIRVTHMPTGIVAQCQDQKSKIKNLEKAMSVLRSRIYEVELAKKQEADAARRKSMVSSSDRSAKIRTYNYPQGRVTDHRINLTLYNLASVMDGDVHELIDQLKLAENTEKLKEGGL
ncbi:MAG: peptide chain release factor 1 [Luteibaculaceae bacterium]